MRVLYEFINGILTPTEDDGAWNLRGAEYVTLRTDFKGQAFQYFTGPLSRCFGQAKRIARLAHRWERDKNYGYNIRACGHSAGVPTIVNAALQFSGRIQQMHLFQGAMSGDCEKNGINALLRQNKVGTVIFYCSKGDMVLKYLAPLSQLLTLGIIGYGNLGYTGPYNLDPEIENSDRVRVAWRDSFGHSDWFLGDQFEATLQMILQNAADVNLRPLDD